MVNNELFHFPPYPRMILGTITVLPKVDRNNQPEPGRWVLPGKQVISTAQAEALAKARGLYFHILHRRK